MSESTPKGYLSEEGRRSYTILVGLLGLGGLVAQFALPYAIMLAMLPSMFPGGEGGFRLPQLRAAAVWRGALWFPEDRLASPASTSAPRGLCRLPLAADAELDCPASLEASGAVLLAGDDRLWVLAEEGIATFDGTALGAVDAEGCPGSPRSPFLLDGKPGVVVLRPGAWSVVLLEDGAWRERWTLSAPTGATRQDAAPVQAVAATGRLHLFTELDGSVFHREAGTEGEVPADGSWTSVAHAEGSWSAFAVASGPVVVVFPKGDVGPVRAYRLADEGWEPFFRTSSPGFTVGGTALPEPGSDTFLLAFSHPFGGGRVKAVRGGEIAEEYRFGASPFPRMFKGIFAGFFGSMIAVSLGFALVLSIVMPRYRSVSHGTPEGAATYAPVWRRAVAQVIDAAILSGPTVAGYVSMFSMFDDPESFGPGRIWASMGLVFAGIGWGVAALLAISWAEGRWGVTPGKAAVAIRTLGTDLRPCGFGRALLRNVLTPVDGFFNFLVGMLLVALTEQWQRLGDLVARTVVVTAPSRGAGRSPGND